jgi:hypothetical protein
MELRKIINDKLMIHFDNEKIAQHLLYLGIYSIFCYNFSFTVENNVIQTLLHKVQFIHTDNEIDLYLTTNN